MAMFSVASVRCVKNLPSRNLTYFDISGFGTLLNLTKTFFPSIPPNLAIDSILDISKSQKGLTSKIYSIISRLPEVHLDKIRIIWEEELGRSIDDNNLSGALIQVNDSSSCSRPNLIQFKVVHRIYF